MRLLFLAGHSLGDHGQVFPESETSMRPGVRAGKWQTQHGQCTLILQQSATKGPVGPVAMRQSCLALVGFMGYLVLRQRLTA